MERTSGILLVWDEAKRRSNLQKHGIDFGDLEENFDWPSAMVELAKDSAFGGKRYRLIGELDNRRIVVVIAAPLGSEALSIISARQANPKESGLYERNTKNSH